MLTFERVTSAKPSMVKVNLRSSKVFGRCLAAFLAMSKYVFLKFYKIMLNVLQIKRDYCDSVLSTKARRRYLARGFTRTIFTTKRWMA